MNAADNIDVQSIVACKPYSNAMSSILHFTGFIRGVKYRACLTENLPKVSFLDFNPNNSSASGIIQADDMEVAYFK